MVAEQRVGGLSAPGFSAEVPLTLRVLPNTPPQIGRLRDTIPNSNLNFGVNVGGGTSTGGWGRPALKEPLASEDEAPGTASQWVWQVQGPGSMTPSQEDVSIWDADSLASSGHMDALQLDFGSRTLSAAGRVVGPLEGLKTGPLLPELDLSGNTPVPVVAASMTDGFYNPWIHGIYGNGSWVVAWAPVRSQVVLDRYLGSRVFGFPLIVEDQYGTATLRSHLISPLFGSVRLRNNRFVARRDTLEDDHAPKGDFLASGNTRSGGHRYVLNYLPVGLSRAAGAAEFVQGAASFGAALFGDPELGGAPASGYFSSLGAPTVSAAAWMTVDGGAAGSVGLYPPNPLNELLNPPASAAGAPGTASGATRTFVQFKGGAHQGQSGQPTRLSRTISGPWADAELRAQGIPSTSPWLATIRNSVRPWNGDGIAAAFQGGIPTTDRRWVYGRVQSDVDVLQTLAGRPVFHSQLVPAAPDVDTLATAFTRWAALRVTFSWPAKVTQTAPGWPAAGADNTIRETDVFQVAVPNLSANGRFFFTGNTPGVTPGADQAAGNYLGKFGFTTTPGAFTGLGATRTAAPHQPIHAVTRSLWVPNNADGRNNLPNAYTTPLGGGVNCDIPFTGIRGYLAPAATAGLTQLWVGGDEGLDQAQSVLNTLAVGGHASNPSPGGLPGDTNANPALWDSSQRKDRAFFLWMKQDQNGSSNAYGAWAGTVMQQGDARKIEGGLSTLQVPFVLGNALIDPLASLVFAKADGTENQPLGTGTGMTAWKRSAFESLKDLMGNPGTGSLPGRVRVVDPASNAALSDGTVTPAQFAAGEPTWDGLPANSLVVYALRDRSKDGTGSLGEAGLEPGSPILAQWWNTGTGDVSASAFPGVIQSYASAWLPAGFTEVAQVTHQFSGLVQFPGSAATEIAARVLLQAGLVAPKGHALLSSAAGVVPAVTPVRDVALADLKANTASGTVTLGTQLDLMRGNAAELALGGPRAGDPSFKLADGNAKGADHRLAADSTLELRFRPAAEDLRSPSGYIVTLYQVERTTTGSPRTRLTVLRELRAGHQGGRGAVQKVYLPTLRSMAQGTPGSSLAFVVKIRSQWFQGDEGPDGNTLDLEKQPYAQRIPAAHADFLSGVFVGAY